ncbi:MAG: hypothetical protein M3259_11710 [Actinomycetota bacterium]|nr:hypothetical protein [Actinomycetota bacterium]
MHEDEKCPNERRSTITSTTGGVMTEEVGAVTGELEVATRLRSRKIEVAVRYAEADEWYAVDGSPIAVNNADELSYSELHEHVVRHLTTPGVVVKGNEEPTSLRGFAP